MHDEPRQLPGSELVGILPNDHELWLLLAGAAVEHTARGKGDIVRVEMRGTYTPLVHIDFSTGSAQVPLDSFANGRFTVFLRASVVDQLASSSDEIKKKERRDSLHKEELRKKRNEEQELARKQARLAAAAEADKRDRLREEAERLQLEKRRRYLEALPDRHRAHLERYGLEYRGIRTASRTRSHRVTHCWNCTRELDNAIDVECMTCGWILCNCGACGCGYSREQTG